MSTNAEKLVKYTLKTISKAHNVDYSMLKKTTKNIIKVAKNYDEKMLGVMEELMDLGNVESEKELADFDIETLKIFCSIKDIEVDSRSDKAIRKNVWEYIQEELDEDYSEEEDDSEDDSEDSEELSDESEVEEIEVAPEPEPEPVKKEKKKKKTVVINDPADES